MVSLTGFTVYVGFKMDYGIGMNCIWCSVFLCPGVQVFPGMTLLGWTSHQDEDANHKHLLVTFRRANLKDDRQLKADVGWTMV